MDVENDAKVLGQILEGIPEVVLLVDRDGMVRYINRAEMGYELDQVAGARASDFIFPDGQGMFESALDQVLSTAEPAEFELPMVSADGSMAWYRNRLFPRKDGDEVVGVVVVATNITELKEAQATAERLRRLLPICSWCDRIRTEDGSWETIETYLGEKMQTSVTHGLCPECYGREMDGLERKGERGHDTD